MSLELELDFADLWEEWCAGSPSVWSSAGRLSPCFTDTLFVVLVPGLVGALYAMAQLYEILESRAAAPTAPGKGWGGVADASSALQLLACVLLAARYPALVGYEGEALMYRTTAAALVGLLWLMVGLALYCEERTPSGVLASRRFQNRVFSLALLGEVVVVWGEAVDVDAAGVGSASLRSTVSFAALAIELVLAVTARLALAESRSASELDDYGSVQYGMLQGPLEGGEDEEAEEDAAGIFSYVTFHWVQNLVASARKFQLENSDLLKLPKPERAAPASMRFQRHWGEEVRRSERAGRGELPNIWRVFSRAFGVRLMSLGPYLLVEQACILAGPIFLNLVVTYVEAGESDVWYGVGILVLMLLTQVLRTTVFTRYYHSAFRLATLIQSCLMTALFRKSLKISTAARQGRTIGEIVNLMSIDAQRVSQDMTPFIHYLWATPLQIALCLTLLVNFIGVATVAGVGVMLLSVLPVYYVVSRVEALTEQIMEKRDLRSKYVNEMLQGIRVVKYQSWEAPLTERISQIREEELVLLKRIRYLEAINNYVWTSIPVMTSLATFVTYALLGNTLDPVTVFTALSLFNVMRFPLVALPYLLLGFAQLRVSLLRLRDFLASEEADTGYLLAWGMPSEGPSSPSRAEDSRRIVVRRASFAWDASITSVEEATLRDVVLSLRAGQLTCVVGRVGAGKSSLISAILGEMKRLQGSVHVNGTIAYVAQTPWIQNATLRDNILFGSVMDLRRYNAVLDAVALRKDIESLPGGDDSIEIGEKGINLSGGQKARVALGRGAYANADIVIMDDVLSAVDAHVATHIFQECICGLMKSSARLLVTHATQLLPMADNIIVMNDGRLDFQGDFEELKASGYNIEELCQKPSDEDADEDDDGADGETGDRSDKKKADEDGGATGGGGGGGGGGGNDDEDDDEEDELLKQKRRLMTTEDRRIGAVDQDVYYKYVKAATLSAVSAMLLAYVLGELLEIGNSITLSFWTEDDDDDALDPYITLMFVFTGLSGVFAFLSNIFLAIVTVRASRHLHKKLLDAVTRAPIRFFDTTPIGRVLNRFTKDIYQVDNEVNAAIVTFADAVLRVLGSIIAISYATPVFLAALAPVSFIYYYIQQYYRPAVRDLKRLESISRSPLFAHFSETLAGISTIRATNSSARFVKENEEKVQQSQQATYGLLAANRWLAFRLEILGLAILIIAAGLIIGQNELSSIEAGLAGLSLTYAGEVTENLSWCIRGFSQLETSAISIERVLFYSDLDAEAARRRPSDDQLTAWPSKGAIRFDNVALKYRPDLDLVLKGLSFEIKAGDRVGVCGRTGAGKSSLIVALYRMVEVAAGQIFIDDVDIAAVGLDALRSKLAIIPQDPVLFAGDIRYNLDPFNLYTDKQIQRAIDKSGLDKVITSLTDTVTENGENFSVGQRQLICLARVLLKESCRILILDEATANVDHETDRVVQSQIRTLENVTIISIAHRLGTILDYDRVLVMDQGRVAEYAPPKSLLADKASIFHGLAAEAGIV